MLLVKHGVLRKTKDHLGSTAYYDLVQDPEIFKKELPALFALVEFFRNIEQGQKENIWPKLQEFTDIPYGIGPYAFSLFMAVAIRYLGDELRLKPQPTQIGYAPLNDPELIIAVATGQNPSATVERVEKTQAVTALIDGVYGSFSEHRLRPDLTRRKLQPGRLCSPGGKSERAWNEPAGSIRPTVVHKN